MSNKKKPTNPFLVSAQKEPVYLYPGSITADLERIGNEIEQVAEEVIRLAAEPEGPQLKTRPDSPRAGELQERLRDLQEQQLKALEDGKAGAVKVMVSEVSGVARERIIAANPPREDSEADRLQGVYLAGYQADMVREAMPRMTDQQWDEFYELGDDEYQKSNGDRGMPPVSAYNWEQLVSKVHSMTQKGVDPNGLAASLIRARIGTGTRQRGGTQVAASDD